jgi:ketosteroid isomerase-like protein
MALASRSTSSYRAAVSTPERASVPSAWVDKLEIREVIERSMRYIDDQAGARLGALFDEDAVLQLAGTVFAGREAIGKMFGSADPPHWTEPGELLKQPGGVHRGANPIIDVAGDTATAETDMLVLERDQEGRARITLVARYRDRFRRADDGRWLITNRTGVSIARPGEAGTDAEWARALARMSDETRARFRTD